MAVNPWMATTGGAPRPFRVTVNEKDDAVSGDADHRPSYRLFWIGGAVSWGESCA